MRLSCWSIVFVLVLSFLVSCDDKDDDFSSNPNLRLEFSSDTVSFDTVFTSFGSATKRLKVYNRNSQSLTISSVELAGGEKSPFRMNVDGVGGNSVYDVDILRKDSAYLFIEVTIDPQNSNNPLLIKDSIKFNLNGKVQYVLLEAIGRDVNLWKGKTIKQDTVLSAEKPYLIYDSLIVAKGATLNINEGVELFFHSKAGLNVYGTIDARGTVKDPIVFRGDRNDNLFTDVPYDRIPGQWEGITVDSASFNNRFENVRIRNSVKGILFKASKPNNQKAVFMNTIVHNTTGNGVFAENCKIDGYNSQFSNAGGVALKLIGGEYNFIHCTVANYMSWWGMKKDVALVIGNVSDNSKLMPLTRCEFINSIIAGSSSSEIRLQNKINKEEVNIPFNHYFKNCLIKASGTDDEKFVNIIWKVDPDFANINNDKDYLYSFELTENSPALNAADRTYSESLPFDLVGVYRLGDTGPDIGCYEWVMPAMPSAF